MGKAARRSISLGGSRRIAVLPPGAADATRERLRHASREGEALVEAGVRRLADPFDTLRNRQALDREDKGSNALLWQAGDRLRRHWHGSRLDGLTALDFSRESVDSGGNPAAMTPTEAAIRHRTHVRRAMEAAGPRLCPYLTGIVIRGETPSALRRLVVDTAHARTADALVIDRLREALHRLVALWGLDGKRPARPSAGSAHHLAGIEDA